MSSEQGTTPATEQPVSDTAAQTGEAPAELSLNDLMSLKLIVQVSTRRGCWLAEELEDVGKLYKRLSSFLDRVAPQQDPASTNNADSQTANVDSQTANSDSQATSLPSTDGEKIVI